MSDHAVSPSIAASAKALHVSVEQAEISAAATALGKTGRLLLPNGQSISATELRVVGATADAKKQEALDALLVKKGYSRGSLTLPAFALMCGDLASTKGASFCVPKALFKADEPHATPLAPPKPRERNAGTPALPSAPAMKTGAINADKELHLLPPSEATKLGALAILKEGKLSFDAQKKLVALAMTMLPPGFMNDSRAQTASLTGLFRVMKASVDEQDARDAARDITHNVKTFRYEPAGASPYELLDTMHAAFAPDTLQLAPPRAPDVNTSEGAEKIVDESNGDARADVWTPSMIRATPYAFANALTQIDGDKSTRADRTQCGPMSLIGALALSDPKKLPDMAKAILASPGFFAQAGPFRGALDRIKSGSFTPDDCNQMARAIYASIKNDPDATSGITDDQLALIVSALCAGGLVFPRLEIHHYGSDNAEEMGHYNGVADRNFDPWPGTDGKAVIQTQADAVTRHAGSGRKLLSKIVIDGTTATIS